MWNVVVLLFVLLLFVRRAVVHGMPSYVERCRVGASLCPLLHQLCMQPRRRSGMSTTTGPRFSSRRTTGGSARGRAIGSSRSQSVSGDLAASSVSHATRVPILGASSARATSKGSACYDLVLSAWYSEMRSSGDCCGLSVTRARSCWLSGCSRTERVAERRGSTGNLASFSTLLVSCTDSCQSLCPERRFGATRPFVAQILTSLGATAILRTDLHQNRCNLSSTNDAAELTLGVPRRTGLVLGQMYERGLKARRTGCSRGDAKESNFPLDARLSTTLSVAVRRPSS